MSWSRAEVLALAARAARGAGAPPAQATLFGQVAALHLGQRRAPDDLARALTALPGGPILMFPVALERIMLHGTTSQPATYQMPVEDQPSLAQSYLDTLPFEVQVRPSPADHLQIAVDLQAPPIARTLGRITGCETLIAQMTLLAARTLVPESDASRLAGAGAGLTDTD